MRNMICTCRVHIIDHAIWTSLYEHEYNRMLYLGITGVKVERLNCLNPIDFNIKFALLTIEVVRINKMTDLVSETVSLN